MDEKIINRIRKLLSLAGSSNKHEAAAALDRANDLLVEHNLKLSDVEVVDNERIKVTYEAKRRRQTWARVVWQAVARSNFCKYWFTRAEEGSEKGDRHTIIGTRFNVGMTADFAGAFVKRIEELGASDAESKDQRDQYAFKIGCAHILAERLDAKREAAERAERKKGPVVTEGKMLPAIAALYHAHEAANEEFFKQKYPDVKLRSSSSSGTSRHEAYKRGQKAGKSISLDPQVGKSRRKLIGKS
jgi:Protein of unknown function (DUF2786)